MIGAFLRNVDGFPDYLVKIDGTVINKLTRRILKPSENESGYHRVSLYNTTNKEKQTFFVHKLVCLGFHENPNCYGEINHKNGVKTDNHANNLEWCSKSYNARHSFRFGLQSNEGVKNPAAKLDEKKVREIRALFTAGEMNMRQLAREYGVGESTIRRAIRTHWKHVK